MDWYYKIKHKPDLFYKMSFKALCFKSSCELEMVLSLCRITNRQQQQSNPDSNRIVTA